MDQEISRYLIKLRRVNPFLATVSLFAHYQFNDEVAYFDTDAKIIRLNPGYFQSLTGDEKTGVLLHLTLHSALLHPIRQGLRNSVVWNMAADIVVNNIIIESGDFSPPKNTAIEPKYRELSVEQVYEALMNLHQKNPSVKSAAMNVPVQMDCEKQSGQNKSTTTVQAQPNVFQIQQTLEVLYPLHVDLKAPQTDGKSQSNQQMDTNKQTGKTSRYWQNALRKAEVAAKFGNTAQGNMPAGLLREIDLMMNAVMDWRWLLWNFVVRTPDDFEGFDHRFVHQGLYLDQLQSERLNVLVAVDTSASIEQNELTRFMSELTAICGIYHFIQVTLYYVDADIYGPYTLENGVDQAPPQGGGGTDFEVFYEEVVGHLDDREVDLVVYFTDGFGDFPTVEPSIETLWVVTFGGLESEVFPFGEVARLGHV